MLQWFQRLLPRQDVFFPQFERHAAVMVKMGVPIANIERMSWHVRFVPKADIESRFGVKSSRSTLSKPNKGRIKVQLGTSAAWLNAWALSGVGTTRYEEVL